jgi:hypothetical protein
MKSTRACSHAYKRILPDSNQETVHSKYIKHLRKNNLISLNTKPATGAGFTISWSTAADCRTILRVPLGEYIHLKI